jgi:uncharacterized membrane protein
MKTPNKRYESRVQKCTLKLLYWTVAWLLATTLLAFGDKFLWQEGNTVHAVVAFAIAVLVGIGMVIANKNYLRNLDELHQKVMLEAMGITLGVLLAVGAPYSLLIESGVAPSEDWFAYLMILMSLTFIASVVAGLWRYK